MVIPTVLTVFSPQKNQQKSMVLPASSFRLFYPNSLAFSHDRFSILPENVRSMDL